MLTYDELIQSARLQIRFKGYGNYYELHHVLPLNDGGEDIETNLILLTLYEHALAHYLYAVEHRDDDHIFHANINSSWLVLAGSGNHTFGKVTDKYQFLTDFFTYPDMIYIESQEKERLKAQEAWKKKYLTSRPKRTNKSWIHKDGVNKYVSNGELNKYFQEGWRKGKSSVKGTKKAPKK